jgi:hypothetical protein
MHGRTKIRVGWQVTHLDFTLLPSSSHALVKATTGASKREKGIENDMYAYHNL